MPEENDKGFRNRVRMLAGSWDRLFQDRTPQMQGPSYIFPELETKANEYVQRAAALQGGQQKQELERMRADLEGTAKSIGVTTDQLTRLNMMIENLEKATRQHAQRIQENAQEVGKSTQSIRATSGPGQGGVLLGNSQATGGINPAKPGASPGYATMNPNTNNIDVTALTAKNIMEEAAVNRNQAGFNPSDLADTIKDRGLLGVADLAGGKILNAAQVPKGQSANWQNRVAQGVVGAGALYGGAKFGVPLVVSQIESFFNVLSGLTGRNTALGNIQAGQAAGFQGTAAQSPLGMIPNIYNKWVAGPLATLGMGLPSFGSPAERFGQSQRIEAQQKGFNLMDPSTLFDAITTEEVSSMQQELLNRGYSPESPLREKTLDALIDIKKRYGMDAGLALDYLDVIVKKLGGNLDTAIEELDTFGESAQAAGKSVEQYTKEVTGIVDRVIAGGGTREQALIAGRTRASFRNIPGEVLDEASTSMDPFMFMNAVQQNKGFFENPWNFPLYQHDPTALGGNKSNEALMAGIRQKIDMFKGMYGGDIQKTTVALEQLNLGGGLNAIQMRQLYNNEGEFLDSTEIETTAIRAQEAYDKMETIGSNRTDMGSLAKNFKEGEKRQFLRESPDIRNYLDSLKKADYVSNEDYKKIEGDLLSGRADPNEIRQRVDKMLTDVRNKEENPDGVVDIQISMTPKMEQLLQVETTVSGSRLRSGDNRNRPNLNDTSKPWYRPGAPFGGGP